MFLAIGSAWHKPLLLGSAKILCALEDPSTGLSQHDITI